MMDSTEVGGAPLLGVKGTVIKAHGNSDAKALKRNKAGCKIHRNGCYGKDFRLSCGIKKDNKMDGLE